MDIDQVIEKLEKIREKFGNVKVGFYNDELEQFDIVTEIEIITPNRSGSIMGDDAAELDDLFCGIGDFKIKLLS